MVCKQVYLIYINPKNSIPGLSFVEIQQTTLHVIVQLNIKFYRILCISFRTRKPTIFHNI